MGVVDLVNALLGLMTPQILFSVFWATFLGIIVGMLPGLTATMGIALWGNGVMRLRALRCPGRSGMLLGARVRTSFVSSIQVGKAV